MEICSMQTGLTSGGVGTVGGAICPVIGSGVGGAPPAPRPGSGAVLPPGPAPCGPPYGDGGCAGGVGHSGGESPVRFPAAIRAICCVIGGWGGVPDGPLDAPGGVEDPLGDWAVWAYPPGIMLWWGGIGGIPCGCPCGGGPDIGSGMPGETIESSIGLFASKVKDISNTFYDWESIVKWINHQCRRHGIIEKTVIAKTFQRRDIIVLKISEGDDKPIVFIVGGEDGKDWTSSAVALNFDRMWSKNRQDFFPTVRCSKSFVAIGVNIARNWYFHDVKRTLHEECQGVYVGRKRLSEEETFGLSYALNTLAVNTMAFINVKGFGKFVTIPYAHSTPTNNHDIVSDILTSACNRVQQKFNVTYYITIAVTWPIGLRQN
ncbi:unnamed protein product [Leptidea sinapis]|uniref:Peptidase M14 domain-containing protein n=1 Tax=Leptidea sinapis TaxID=189913 RepID=A0A5E4Q4V6_9NEOP|nr:unnamed protein product [Leptidea sinapis]